MSNTVEKDNKSVLIFILKIKSMNSHINSILNKYRINSRIKKIPCEELWCSSYSHTLFLQLAVENLKLEIIN